MKPFFTLMPMACALLTGCVTGKNGGVPDTVGPSPGNPLGAGSTKGTLVVDSAYEVGADFASRDPNSPEYSDYDILTSDGMPLQKVHNNSGTILQNPVSVELPPGKYRVSAFANGYVNRITVPVVVEKRKTTVLHLEGGGFGPDESGFKQTSAVRLSNGMIIGWKAVPNS